MLDRPIHGARLGHRRRPDPWNLLSPPGGDRRFLGDHRRASVVHIRHPARDLKHVPANLVPRFRAAQKRPMQRRG
jgi:hypothetical protein